MESLLDTMGADHPRWEEFVNRLCGEDGCNFRKNDDNQTTWDCDHDHAHTTRILEDMGGFDIPDTIFGFTMSGGLCDCEVIFNMT